MTFPSGAGVYEIRNALSGRRYVGSSATLRRRIDAHKFGLRHGKHPNIRLQRAWDRDGESAFRFTLLAVLEESEVLPTEQRLLDQAQSFGETLYNFAPFADAPMRGRKASLESRARMSAAGIRRNMDPAQRKARSDSMKKFLADPAVRAEWSEKRKEEWANPTHRAARSDSNRRTTADPVVRAKMSASRVGLKASAGARENMRRAQQVSAKNSERRKKISDAARARWADPEGRAKLLAGLRRHQQRIA